MSGSTIAPLNRQVLPTNVKPLHYGLSLEPHFDTFKFDGQTAIDLQVNETSSSVELHALDLEIHETKLIVGSKEFTPLSSTPKKDDDSIVFEFDNNVLKAGEKAQLRIKFTGELNDKMAGFYRSSYQENGETKYLATTQMEPTDCRRAFPCFDEPSLKATFDITLVAKKELVCLSNMDVKSESVVSDEKKSVSFNTTPLISTYLIAFIVGDLKCITAEYKYRIPVKVYATPGLEHQGKFSVELAAKTLEFFEKKFDIEYPLPKMDMVAIHDFSAGAMENFGLVTYRVVDLLFDEKNSNLATKQRVAEVVQHELAHQWFGNLVTMDWWEGLWLNEGFATWMSWYSCNEFYPEWKVWEQYVTDSLQQALALDALRSSHPIEVPVKRADEINQIFDAISYAKGSSLLKMISRWLGEDTFIKGVSNYLKKHKFGNTKTSDLWESLSEASGQDVVKVMDIWTKQIGYPVLTVEEKGEKISVTQNRYLTTGDVKPSEDETLYPVFLGLKTSDGTDESVVLDTRTKEISLKDASFFKLNADSAGIYRTNYSPERWAKLGEAGSQGLLSVEDRAGLVADAGALATSGYSSTANLLSLVASWKSEPNFVVWDEIVARVGGLKAAFMFEDEKVQQSLDKFIQSLVVENCHKLGWNFEESDSFMTQKLKGLLFAASVGAKDPACVSAAKEMFEKYVGGDKEALHPNLRTSVFNCAARDGDEKVFDKILKIYQNPISIEEKLTALRSLGRFEDPKIIETTLSLLLDGSSVRSQDIYIPMQGLRSHPTGVNALFKWMTTNWDAIHKLLPPGLSMLSSVVTLCTSGFTKPEQKEKVEAFFVGKATKGFDQGLAQSLDMIQSKISWVQRDYDNVVDWLKKH